MYSSNFSLPARRSAAAIGAAVALAAGTLAVAPTAQATTSGSGKSTATVLRAGLDVSLLDKTADVPLNVSLNDVHAPADARETALSATLAGVDDGRPFNVLEARVATAKATANQTKAEGYVNIAHATVHLPGLPLLSLIDVDAVTAKATCESGKQPTASAHLVNLFVLGQKVSVNAKGTVDLAVPGVGNVKLDLLKTETTSSTGAATALELNLTVNPLSLNVAEVTGKVTLARATCEVPSGGSSGGTSTGGGSSTGGSSTGGSSTGGSSTGGSNSGSTGGSTSGSSNGGSSSGSTSGSSNGGTSTGSSTGSSGSGGSSSGQSGSGGSGGHGTVSGTGSQASGGGGLASTGSSSSTPYLAAGAVALVAVGGGAFYLTRRRRG